MIIYFIPKFLKINKESDNSEDSKKAYKGIIISISTYLLVK